MPYLKINKGEVLDVFGKKVLNYPLEKEITTIGRSHNNDLRLIGNKKVSRYHAAIVKISYTIKKTEYYIIRDLGSLHFIRVNGNIVSRKLLEDGDLIELESLVIEYNHGQIAATTTCPIEILDSSKPAILGSAGETATIFSQHPTEYFCEFHDHYRRSLPFPQQQALLDFLSLMQRIETLPVLLSKSIELVVEILGAETGFIALFDKGNTISDYALRKPEARFQIERSIVSRLLQEKCYCDQLSLAFPIRTNNRVFGFVYLKGTFEKTMQKPGVELWFCLGDYLGKRIKEIKSLKIHSKDKEKNEDIFEWSVNLIAHSKRMVKIKSEIDKIAPAEINVLILGESGTGKELIAKEIHRLSGRADQPYVIVDCTKLHEPTLAHSELFGHRKGSFTGAINDRKGAFASADKGTIFLDEIGEVKADMQMGLLRVMDEKVIQPHGSNIPLRVDVRILAATNRDLPGLVANGKFREDLYYRLQKGIVLNLPPLRERVEDIPLLSHFFVDTYTKKHAKHIKGISHGAMRLLMEYSWPGNIRELEGYIDQAVARATDEKEFLFVWDFPPAIQKTALVNQTNDKKSKTLKELEMAEIERILAANNQNVTKSAKVLGIPRQTLYRKIKKYGIKL